MSSPMHPKAVLVEAALSHLQVKFSFDEMQSAISDFVGNKLQLSREQRLKLLVIHSGTPIYEGISHPKRVLIDHVLEALGAKRSDQALDEAKNVAVDSLMSKVGADPRNHLARLLILDERARP